MEGSRCGRYGICGLRVRLRGYGKATNWNAATVAMRSDNVLVYPCVKSSWIHVSII